MTLRKSLIGGIFLSISPLLLNAISLPAIALLIRKLGPLAYGQWVMASALIASVSMLASLGLRGAFVRHLATKPSDISVAVAEQLGTRLALSGIAAVIAILIAATLHYPAVTFICVLICGLAMILNTVATTLVDLLLAKHQTQSIAIISFTSGLVLTLASVVASLLEAGPVWIALAYLMGPLVLLGSSLVLARRYTHVSVRLNLKSVGPLLYRSRAFTAQQLLNSAPIHAEAMLLPRLIGITQFGFFGAGTLLASRLTAIPDGLCTAAFPMLSEQFRVDRARGVWLAIGYGAIITGIALLIAVAAALLSGPFSRLLFPLQPQQCQFVLLITIWALPLMAMDSSLGYAINAADADVAQAQSSVPAALCNILITIYLMTSLGIVGACIALPARHLVRIVFLTLCCFQIRRRSINDPTPTFASIIATN